MISAEGLCVRTPHDHGRPLGRFAWTDVQVLCLAFAAAWYLSRYEHYSVPAAVLTSAAALGLFTLSLSVPRSAYRITALLAALGGAPATTSPDPTTSVITGGPAGRR